MGDIGVLVVHGIGAQKEGETLAKLLAGLRQFPAGDVAVDPSPFPSPSVARATVGGQPVRFYEVYWAEILTGDQMAGAFLLEDLESVTWFPWLNARRGDYRAGDYTRFTVAWWCIVLPLVNFLILLAYWGARILVLLPTAAFRAGKEPRRSVTETARAGTSMRTVFDHVLDEYAGDVFAYVHSAGHGFYREANEPPVNTDLVAAYPKIVQRFYDVLLQAQADGCTTIQVVAHSLGTVVTYHALSGYGFDLTRSDAGRIREALATISDVYTIGSPLEKIRFFWPRLHPAAPLWPGMTLRWNNFVSWFDPVAGTLRRFNQWGPVTELPSARRRLHPWSRRLRTKSDLPAGPGPRPVRPRTGLRAHDEGALGRHAHAPRRDAGGTARAGRRADCGCRRLRDRGWPSSVSRLSAPAAVHGRDAAGTARRCGLARHRGVDGYRIPVRADQPCRPAARVRRRSTNERS